MIEIDGIKELIPHRDPFLLVDRIVSIDNDIPLILGEKDINLSLDFFKGHFPERPIMPGVLVLEALAQTGVVYLFYSKILEKGDSFFFTTIEKAKFKRAVVPGDCLSLEVRMLKSRSNFFKMSGVATVDKEVAAEAVISAFVTR
ncbi:MAG: 3-hydroxyacyl-[acyl-carrier-protein] dehydratase FabZ [Nitrospinae bacterium]|nr:3-hydroxyacyl-[acyl-carrier-protein] dehydratase FabZ [Nitrospinota bacterium]